MISDHWHIVCKGKKIRGQNPFPLVVFNKQLVLFRTKEGDIVALEDVCPHRNMPLSKGKVCNNILECSYHGWRFGKEGHIANIPSMSDKNDWPKNLKVPSYHCCEQDGYVWVSMAKDKPEQPPAKLPYIGIKGWKCFDMVTSFDGQVEDCLENFLDCAHAQHVHKYWFRSPTGKKIKASIRTEDAGAVVEYFNEPRQKSLIWKTFGRHKAYQNNTMVHTDRFIAPSTSRVDYILEGGRQYVIVSNCTPVNENKTIVYTYISLKMPLGWLVRLFFEVISRLIIYQDVQIMREQQKNISRMGKKKFTYVKSDLIIRHIVAWRKAIETGNTPPSAGKEDHVTITL